MGTIRRRCTSAHQGTNMAATRKRRRHRPAVCARNPFNRKRAQGACRDSAQATAQARDRRRSATLPFYNADYESDPPQVVRDFKQKIESFDAVLFVTPEYNRSVPRRAEERDRRRIASVRQKGSWSRKPRRCDQRVARCDRRIRC